MTMDKKIKFNYVDVIIILMVVLVFVAGFKFVKKGVTSSDVLPAVSFTVEIKSVPEEYKTNFEIGDKIRDAVKGDTLGVVTKVESKPSSNLEISSDDGTYKISEYAGREDVYITIKGTPTSYGANVIIAQQEIKVGKMIYIKKPGCVGRGYIVEMETEKEDGANGR